MVKLDIISDPICPWCFIGKAHLFRALEAHPDHPFTLEWHPFQLNPDMPPEGMDRRAYLEGKFGGTEGALNAYAPIVETSEKMGLGIRFDAIERTPNTLNAHRLIHWAGLEERQTPMVQALFDAYFLKGQDIGDTETLVTLATGVGLEADMVSRLLESDADLADIRARDAHSRARGVSGVPTFVLAGQHVLRGAQPPELWGQVVKDVMDQLQSPEA